MWVSLALSEEKEIAAAAAAAATTFDEIFDPVAVVVRQREG